MRKLLATAAIVAAFGLPTIAHAAPSAGAQERVGIGAFIGDSYRDPHLYDEWAREVGRAPVMLGSYRAWTIPLIDPEQLDAIWSRSAVPLVTWEPWGEEGGPVFRLKDIAAGAYDGYVRRSAEAAAAWGHPIFIRFAHEMNGGWYPWGRGVNGDTPRIYKEAWWRIVRIFEAAGADNVRWVWCPNENSSGRFPFRQYYPGDRWVDWVGLDGFNWLRSPHWQSFGEIFSSSYNSLVGFTDRPVMIAETGSWETGGSKAAWVSDALRRELPEFGHVRALLWWSVDDSRGDLRVDSSAAALAALRSALQSPRYAATRSELIEAPARLGAATPVPVSGEGGFSIDRVKRTLRSNYVWIGVVALAASMLVLAGVLIGARRARQKRAMARRVGASSGHLVEGEEGSERESAAHDALL
jgi:hypothetical protein